MIIFETLRYKNFMSTGSQFTCIQLNRSPTTLIIGDNGSGKSSGILDGLCFALFNKPFRSINKSQIINSINRKDCVVEVEFSINDRKYLVRRGIKPNLFEIYLNGVMVNQDADVRDYQQYLEDHVLKMNFKSFTQIVILGSSSYVPFMQLTAANRREIIDNLLDVNVFTIMSQLLKTKLTDNKEAIRLVDGELSILKSKVDIQKKYVDALEKDGETKKVELLNSINKVDSELNNIRQAITEKDTIISDLASSISDKSSSLKEDIQKTRDMLNDFRREQVSVKKDLTFFQTHDICNTCSQDITEEHRQSHISDYDNRLANLANSIEEYSVTLVDLQNRYEQEVVAVESDISRHKSERSMSMNRLSSGQQYIEKLKADLAGIDDTVRIEQEKASLKSLAKEAMVIAQKKNELMDEMKYLTASSVMLKDSGIKSKIIKQYIPIINKLINKYLSAFDFFISFELDENFNEVIRSRHRDEFSYESFSEGEKEKINLAILFTWREIAKLKNSSNTNLLICDEVLDGSLDSASLDNLLGIFGNQRDANLFVISHSPDNYFDKFRSILKFEKRNNYSVIV